MKFSNKSIQICKKTILLLLFTSVSAPELGDEINKSSDLITETFSAIWFTLDADLATDKITSSRFWLSGYNKTVLPS